MTVKEKTVDIVLSAELDVITDNAPVIVEAEQIVQEVQNQRRRRATEPLDAKKIFGCLLTCSTRSKPWQMMSR